MSSLADRMSVLDASDPSSEKNASSPSFGMTTLNSTPIAKLRSCILCRNRKVRCDKQQPCSNCRRANVACVFPSTTRPPRWTRGLENNTKNISASATSAAQHAIPNVDRFMEKLYDIENMLKELRTELEQARTVASSEIDHALETNSSKTGVPTDNTSFDEQIRPSEIADTTDEQFGRLVLQDVSSRRYISSGFWSRVDDELDDLEINTPDLERDDQDSSEDEVVPMNTSFVQQPKQSPPSRNAFFFQHNVTTSAPDAHKFHPLPSQVPFLLDVFSENVNFYLRIVHIPTITKMVRSLRGNGTTKLSPSNEALMFSIYYAAIVSMEEEDVVTNFGSSKTELSIRYRLGLENALMKADFLITPNMILVQAFAIYLCLARRHDSPRYVWMMTGLLIRMAQYIGLQRDGSHFKHLTPFEIEMRRRVWWVVCLLDLRASEDQGTDLTISSGSFDTKIASNINDADIHPESEQMPKECTGMTDLSFARISAGATEVMRQLMAPGVRGHTANLENKSRQLKELYWKFEEGYLQYTAESTSIFYGVAVTIARLVMAKMTLIVFLPVLFSSPTTNISDEIRNKLLISAIEVAEYNHELNAREAYRQWRWIYQTHTHWHAIVYLMIEASRRQWSPMVERAWIALHSSWLIPTKAWTNKDMHIWIPLQKLMDKARKHRNAELNRLRADSQAATRSEIEDQSLPVPSSSGQFATGCTVDIVRERWRQLLATPEQSDRREIQDPKITGTESMQKHNETVSKFTSIARDCLTSSRRIHQANENDHPQQRRGDSYNDQQMMNMNILGETDPQDALHIPSSDWPESFDVENESFPWPWTNLATSVEPLSNMDIDNDINWYEWVESARGAEYNGSFEVHNWN